MDAVKEEVEEAEENLIKTKDQIASLWRFTKKNLNKPKESAAESIKEFAIELAIEAIQVAAMAQKFIDSRREGRMKGEQNNKM